jgi:hypothetical protein
MIDPNAETLIALGQVPKRLPRRRAGKRVHVSCVYRWTKVGCRGKFLDFIQVGGTRCTSLEAIARFFDELTESAGTGPAPTVRSTAQRERAVKAAIIELERAGA